MAPSTLDAVWHRHFADSAQLLPLAPAARTWVDLGSGAGFPGLVVAILLADAASSPSSLRGEGRGRGARSPEQACCPSPPPPTPPRKGEGSHARRPHRITLIESNTRKCAFLREVARQTGIVARVAVDILSTRIETAATQASLPAPDVVSARALAPLDKLLALAAPLIHAAHGWLVLEGPGCRRGARSRRKGVEFQR